MHAVSPPRRVGLELLAERDLGYGRKSRDAVIRRLGTPLGSVLDVGCGEGGSADALRAHGATRIAGVELSKDFGAIASERYDEVFIGSVEKELPWEPGSFDVVLCYDVLEHLYDPWRVLRALHPLLRPGGRLHISIPNARHKDVWIPLVLGGTFKYQSAGLMDVTHIRFFTRRDAVAAVGAAGYKVVSATGPEPGSTKQRIAYGLTRGRAAECLTTQWYILAQPVQ